MNESVKKHLHSIHIQIRYNLSHKLTDKIQMQLTSHTNNQLDNFVDILFAHHQFQFFFPH